MAGTGALIVKIAKQTQAVEDRAKLSALNSLLIGVLSNSEACRNTFNGNARTLDGLSGEFTALKDRDDNVLLDFTDSLEKTRLRKLYGLENPKLRLKCLSAIRDACKCQGTSPTPILPCEKQWTLELTRGGGNSPYETGLRLLISYKEEDKNKLECNVQRPPTGGDATYVYAFHSQERTPPNCPTGWTSLWTGFSYLGGGNDHFIGPDGLDGPGSCLERFKSVPYTECMHNWHCNYLTTKDYAAWLVTKDTRRFDPIGVSRIARCRVCEGNKKLFVKHSQTNRIPKAPPGWTLLWDGYSYHGGGDSYAPGGSLSRLGSCLWHFVPIPYAECGHNDRYIPSTGAKCRHISKGDRGQWLTTRFHNTGGLQASYEKPFISRCAVFIKD